MATAPAKRFAAQVARRLRQAYPDARCALQFANPLELLVATILSAQCTDKQVNIVTPELFKKYPTATDLAAAPIASIERIVQSTGFFRNKAKNIQACCRKLVDEHDGEVPRSMEALVALPGVGRKTANVVLGTAFGIASGVVVDTHVGRITHRLGLTAERDPVKIERDLMAQLPKREWIDFSHELIHHGRQICIARRPKCEVCPLAPLCPRIGVEAPGPVRRVKKTSVSRSASRSTQSQPVSTGVLKKGTGTSRQRKQRGNLRQSLGASPLLQQAST
jgi:endonuclease III